MSMRRITGIISSGVVLAILGLVGGCSTETGPDSHTDVFKTAGEATEARRAKLRREWQDLASRIANAERPDVKTRKVDPFGLVLSADGVGRSPLALTRWSSELVPAGAKTTRLFSIRRILPRAGKSRGVGIGVFLVRASSVVRGALFGM